MTTSERKTINVSKQVYYKLKYVKHKAMKESFNEVIEFLCDYYLKREGGDKNGSRS